MVTEQKLIPYTKHIVTLALYDILELKKSEYTKNEKGEITAAIMVYGNFSEFIFSIEDCNASSLLTVCIKPGKLLSKKGEIRAVHYIIDSMEQYLENELADIMA